MLPKLLTSIFGSRNDRLLKQYRQVVQKVNALEASFEQLSDTELRAKTEEFRRASAPARRSTRSCPRRSPPSARRASGR
jgi:preprotein translocase subunit SecA